MKRWFALILSIVVILTLALPTQSFAANVDKSLENAIKIAKATFDIPANYKFDSSINMYDTKKVFNLSWTSPDTTEGININVNIDENGKVQSYYRSSPSDYTATKKLPKISRQDAKKKADGYIKKIDPSLTNKLSYDDNNQNNSLDSFYYLTYHRVENGIPVYNNQASLTISRETGALQSYYLSWTDGLVFPSVEKAITLKQAEDAYKDKLGLKLIYRYTYEDNVLKTYVVYVPRYDNYMYGVDALTGEKIQVDNNYYGPYYDSYNGRVEKSMASDQASVTLNPDEQKAVTEAGKLISETDAEKIARGIKYLGLTDEFKLNSYSLYQNWPLRTDYVWNLSFNKEAKDSTGYSEYVGVGLDAKTGDLLNFYKGTPYKEGAVAKYDKEACKAAVDKFLQENFPDTYKELEYDETFTNMYKPLGSELPTSQSFKYNRLVNGTAFPDNGINVDYDAVNGAVTNFNKTWFGSAEFPAVDKVIPVSDAFGKMFESVGLELQYKLKTPEINAKVLPVPSSQVKPDVKAVYAFKPNKPLVIDANKGILLGTDGKPYKEIKPVSYTDISGNPAEKQIMVLADNGIYLEGAKFRPNEAILQKDFLSLLLKTINYYGPVITPNSTKAEIDNVYTYLMRENIIKAGEKAPDAAVTREDAVKFIIRALKYDKVADIKGIYSCTYKDKSKINPALTGYVTIAAGLKIDNGSKGYFNPKVKLTRAGAAVMIYNYLQV